MAAPTPNICLALVGPLGVGKSAFLKALLNNEFDLESGAQHCLTEELEFGHANIFKCSSDATRATCYRSSGHQADMQHIGCDTESHEQECFILSGRAAFVDCPGHFNYVSTMLKGIMMADGVLILSQPTDGFEVSPVVDALAGAHLMGKSIIIVQIIKSTADRRALKAHNKEIRSCISNLKIPAIRTVEVHTSSALKGIGAVCGEVIRMMSQPRGELAASSSSSGSPAAFMLIARSSVVDPVGQEEVDAVAAAAAAGDALMFATIIGRVMQGIVSAGDEVEVRPGVEMDDDDGKIVCYPIKLKVVSVLAVRNNSEDEEEEAQGDGLVALRASATIVNVDENDKRRNHHWLVGRLLGGRDEAGAGGHVLGRPGSLPDVYDALRMEVLLIPRISDTYTDQVYEPLPPVEAGEELLLIIGTMSTCGTVTKVKEVTAGTGRKKEKRTTIVLDGLTPPTWARYLESILICRQSTLSWNVIGSGKVLAGKKLPEGSTVAWE